MNNKYLLWAIVVTLLTVVYYAWMIPAWIHLDDPPKTRSVKRAETETKYIFGDDEEVAGKVLPNCAFYISRPKYRCDSVLKINTSRDAGYVIKVVDSYDGEVMLVCYLPPGVSQEIDLPSGTFEIRYTSGTKWYGNYEMFGREANYSKAQGLFKFSEGEGYELTLYRVPHGNLHTSRIRKEDF